MYNLKLLKNNYLLSIAIISFYTFPISLIAGSLFVNLNIIFFTTIGIIYCFLNKIKYKFNFINLSLFLFFCTLIVSSFINLDVVGVENFIKSILLLKFFLLYLVTETLIKNTKFEINFFFKLCFFLIIFLSLDLSIQYFFGKNILGLTPHEGRISGIFGHEAIAGAYLQKIFIFSFIGMSFFLFDIENKKNSFLIILFLILIIFASFIGSNRISFFILISLIIFLSFLFSIFRKKLIFSILCIVPILYYFYQNDLSIKSRYSGFFYKTENLILNVKDIYLLKKNEKIGEIKNELSNDNSQIKESKLLLANHGKIYLTAFHSFKEKMFLGNGYKSFRSKCVIFTKKNDNYLCSTHPHNYHLEVLHDTGLIGFFILTLFIFSLLIKSLYRIFKTKLFYYEKLILSLLIINLSIELFPLKSTGSLLTTWNGTLVWIAVALINYKNYGNFVKKD